MPNGSLMDWIMRNSTLTALYAFPYCSCICLISSSSFPLHCLSWLLMVENFQQVEPAVGKLIDHPHLSQTVYTYGPDGFPWEHTMPHNFNVISYPFPRNTQAVSSFFHLFFFLPTLSLSLSLSLSLWVTNPSFFKQQLTIQEYEELVWLAGNLKLEVTNYSRSLYGLKGVAYLGGGDDDDDGDDEEDSKATSSYQPRKRQHHYLPVVKTHRHTTQIFLFLLLLFFISFSKNLNSV